MSCTLPERIKEVQDKAIKAFVKNGTGFTINNNLVSREVDNKFSKNMLYYMFTNNVKRIDEWAKKEFPNSPIFQKNWYKLYTANPTKVELEITVPKPLIAAFKVKIGEETIEEANKEISGIRPEGFYNGDQALEDQEERDLLFKLAPKKSELYNQIESIPHVENAEQAKEIFLNAFSDKLKKQIGDWETDLTPSPLKHKEGEPKLFFKTPDGSVYNSYAEALKNTYSGQIEIGFIYTDDIVEAQSEDEYNVSLADFTTYNDKIKLENKEGFISVLSVDADSNGSTKNGFINKSIREGLIKGEKVNGKIVVEGQTHTQKVVNLGLLRQESIKHLGYEAMKTNMEDFSITLNPKNNLDEIQIGDKTYSKNELVQEWLNGNKKYVEDLVDINSLIVDYVFQNRKQDVTPTLPVTEKEENVVRNHFLSLLKQLGVSVTTISNYITNYQVRNGVDISVEAIADVTNSVIAFAEGKDTLENLSEETAHFIVEYYNNQEEVNSVLPQVRDTTEYAEFAEIYREKYSKLYKDAAKVEEQVDKEILGKLLAKSVTNALNNNIQESNPSLLDLFSNFMARIRNYFLPTHKTALDGFLKKAADIAVRKDTSSIIKRDVNTILYSVNTEPSATVSSLESKNRRNKIALEKLKRNLEQRMAVTKSLKDPESRRIRYAISQMAEVIDRNEIEIGAQIAIETHGAQINKLQRRLTDYLKQEEAGSTKAHFTQEDASAFNYLTQTAFPMLLEIKSLVEQTPLENDTKKKALIKKLGIQISAITELQSSRLKQKINDPTNIVDEIIALRGENITEQDRDFLVKLATNTQKDVNWFASTWFGLQGQGNIFLNWLGKVISSNKFFAESTTGNQVFKLLEKAKAKGWNINSYRKIIKKDENGKNTGYFISEIDYAKASKAKKDFYRSVYATILGEDFVTNFEKQGKRLTEDLIPMERYAEYRRAVVEWKIENEELPRKAEYYRKKQQQYEEANLGKENILFLEEISKRRAAITSKYNVAGRVDYSQLTEIENAVLAELDNELKARKSFVDAETGEQKTGVELQQAEELKRLSDIRSAEIQGRENKNISEDFINTLRTIEDEQGRQAAVNFLLANGGITFTEDYWNTFTKAVTDENGNEVKENKLKTGLLEAANNITNVLEKAKTMNDIERYVTLLEKRKQILKQHTSNLNPSEIDASTFTATAKETFLEIEEEIEKALKSINSVFSVYKQKLVPTTSTENTTNESYEKMLIDSELSEIEFIKNNATASSNDKIRRFENNIQALDKTNLHLERFIIKYFEMKHDLGVYDGNGRLKEYETLLKIEEHVRTQGKDNVIVEYGKSKITSYFKRFAPEGYSELMDSIKNGTESVTDIAERINNKQIPYLQISTRYEWLDNKSDEATLNPNYEADTESGYFKPKKSIYADSEYQQRYNVFNGVATTNKEEWDMLQELKGLVKMAYESYGETGANINKLPQKSKSGLERQANYASISSLGSKAKNVREWFKDTISNRVDDLQYGEKIDGIDINTDEKLIPKYFINDLESTEDISEDLLNSTISMLYAANLYKARQNTINEVLAKQQMVLNSTFEDGKAPDKTNVAKTYKNFMDAFFYGVKSTQKVSYQMFGREVDISKAITKLDAFKRRANNAFSAPIAIASAGVSIINLGIEGIVGEYTSTTSSKWASKELRKLLADYATNYGNINRKDKLYLIHETFGLNDLSARTENTAFGKAWRAYTDLPFSMLSIFSTPHSSVVALGTLDDNRLIDGQFITLRTFKRRAEFNGMKESQILHEWAKHKKNSAYNLLEQKEGETFYSFNEDTINKLGGVEAANKQLQFLRDRIIVVNGNIDGLVSDTDRSAATRNFALNLTTSHKGWLQIALNRRAKRKHYNFNTGEIEEGHYRSLFKLLGDLGGKAFNPKNAAQTSKEIERLWGEMSEVERKNFKRVALELSAFLILSLLSILVAGVADDEDNKDVWAIQFLSYMYFKTTAEMGNSQLPAGALELPQMVQNPFMIMSTITELQNNIFTTEAFSPVASGRYEGYPKVLAAMIKQTYLKQLYTMPDIKATSDQYRNFNSGVLWLAQRKKRNEEPGFENTEFQTLIDITD